MKLQDASSFKDQIFEQMESQIVNGNCYYEDYYIFEDGIKRNMTLDQKTTIDTFNSETTKFMKDWIFGDEGWQKSSPNVTSNIEDWPQVPCLCAYCKNETSLGPK
uniref:Uncharacterized protein n=1 Tax=Rhabditophanes sp. KR3021 TaxID=114890 RepID=A0AC35UGS5_9BILA